MRIQTRRSRIWQSLLVIVVCVGIAAGATLAMREARSAKCPCGASAAMVRLTGTTITLYTQAWIAWTYILLAFNFSALNAQINGNIQGDTEMGSHHLGAFANNRRQALAWRQNIRQEENPDHSFQATVASVSGVIDADQMTQQDAIMRENIEWVRGLTEDTMGTTQANAAAANRRTRELYCGARLAEVTDCTLVDEHMQNADSRAESLLGYSVITEEFRDASIDFCRNIVGSPPQQDLVIDMTPVQSLQAQERETYTARMATVFQACQYIAGIRTETGDGEVRAWAERMRALTSGLADGVPEYLGERSPGATGSSFYELLKFASLYRVTSPRWFTLTQALGDSASVWQQLAAIRATRMFLNWQRLELHKMKAGLTATIQGATSSMHYETVSGRADVAPVDF